MEEQKISNLTIGKEYELYFNLKAYKVLALNDNKVTLPGLTVEKQKIHNEENGSNKNIVRESTYLNAEFDPNSMEIILSDNTISYSKDSHIGGPRGFLLLQRNHYIDDYYNKIIIILHENFEFDILEGNKLSFVKNKKEFSAAKKLISLMKLIEASIKDIYDILAIALISLILLLVQINSRNKE